MKIKFPVLIVAILMICLQNSNSVSGQGLIRFKTGEIQTAKNVESFIAKPQIDQNEIFDGKYYRIITFESIPTAEQRKAMELDGIQLYNYLPEKSYMASFEISANLRVLSEVPAFSVVSFTPSWKLHRDLKSGNIPQWAIKQEGTVDIMIRYHKGADPNAVENTLAGNGANIIRRYDYGKWFEARIPVYKLMDFASLSFVNGLEPVSPPPTPDDEKGRSLHRSNAINSDAPMGRHYDGTGVSVALADDGPVGPHIDYSGRIDQSNSTANSGTHGDMTAGILMGAGNLNPTIRGMGTGAFIYIYDIGGYNHVLNSPTTNQTLGVMVTSTSYSQGCNDYSTDTQTGDQILNQNPTLMHVYSGGNNGTGNCNYGAGSGWGNITGGYKQGKNVIACGNLSYLDVLESSSSRGPSEDGRIKPDICANGVGQLSTNGPNTYQTGGGTSAACPGVAGILTQLHQAYRDLYGGQNAEGALLKACLLNSAEDLGNPGPDFRFGWGRVNALRAVTTLEDNRYFSGLISQGTSASHSITVPANTKQLRVMIYWSDVEGDPLAAKALVNDLNVVVSDPTSNQFQPWVLNSAPNATTLNANAVRGTDDLNNMEQVTIDDPAAGIYTVNIDGFLVPQGPQKYYLVYEFRSEEIEVTYPIGYEGFVPGETETIRWDTYGNVGTFTMDYSIDNGANWTTASATIPAAQRFYNWTVPANVTGQALVRVTRNGFIGQSPEPFSIIGLPSNITVDWACPDSVRLVWNAVPGATGYEVSKLGTMYMDSSAYSTTTSAVVTGTNPTVDQWFSVRAITPDNTKGRRANAVYKAPGVFSCPIALDASLNQLVSPPNTLQSCQGLANVPVTVRIDNDGLSPISNIPVSYSLNGAAPVIEVVTGTIAPGAFVNYTFTSTLNLSNPNSYSLQVWTGLVGDGNTFNDTSNTNIQVSSGTIVNLPYSENFETQTNCATANNCAATVCALTNGWINLANGDGDDIDWRVNAGVTPSANTGPDVDHNPGTATGKYVYLEASACFSQEAILVSPCINLAGSSNPVFEFWYHLYGANMGELHTDIYVNGNWILDAYPVLSGNLGNAWQLGSLNLAAYNGQIINVRFRGNTGLDFASDMAIDDIFVYDTSAPPVAAFNVNPTNICVGQTINLTDLSTNLPISWNWVITPSTGFTFANGTSSASQNPNITFSTAGSYDIQLTVSNSFGSSTVTQNTALSVGIANSLPITETFQAANFPPVNWNVENVDNSTTWVQSTSVTGADGNPTLASFMDNYNYNAAGQEDGILTERIDLNNVNTGYLTFDVAHARYSQAYEDALRIDISTDCGATFIPSGYLKQGTALATVPDQTTLFTPQNASNWRKDTLDLSGYVNNEIIVKFVNITGYGNSLYLDNINVDFTSSLAQNTALNALTVYPNPGTGLFTLEISSSNSSKTNITVADTKGSIVYDDELVVYKGVNRRSIDLTNLPKGVYQLKINDGVNVRAIKLVVI
ncbi:MAG: S8 family serine peptidase [Bacteroidota bacterium]